MKHLLTSSSDAIRFVTSVSDGIIMSERQGRTWTLASTARSARDGRIAAIRYMREATIEQAWQAATSTRQSSAAYRAHTPSAASGASRKAA